MYFKICLTYFEICQTYFPPHGNPFENRPGKADKTQTARLDSHTRSLQHPCRAVLQSHCRAANGNFPRRITMRKREIPI